MLLFALSCAPTYVPIGLPYPMNNPDAAREIRWNPRDRDRERSLAKESAWARYERVRYRKQHRIELVPLSRFTEAFPGLPVTRPPKLACGALFEFDSIPISGNQVRRTFLRCIPSEDVDWPAQFPGRSSVCEPHEAPLAYYADNPERSFTVGERVALKDGFALMRALEQGRIRYAGEQELSPQAARRRTQGVHLVLARWPPTFEGTRDKELEWWDMHLWHPCAARKIWQVALDRRSGTPIAVVVRYISYPET